MPNTGLKLGIYGGIAICVFKGIEFLPVFQKTRIESGIDTGLLALVIAAAFIIWGIKTKRSASDTNTITFTQAFTTGLTITVLMTVITVPPIYLYGKFIHPREAKQMIEYIDINHVEDAPAPEMIQEYYAPGHRSKQTGKDILLTGFFVSLLSGIMFRRTPTTEEDYIKETILPSKVRSFFTFSIVFSFLPVIVYLFWLLKWTNISSFMYDLLLTDPMSDADVIQQRIAFLSLQEGTAFLSLAAVILNIISYNNISEFGNRVNIWNLRMILISGILFLISLWPILHSLY
jgi:hypothetical protein